MDNIEGSRVTFTVDDGTNSSQISSASDHAQVSRFELDEVLDLAGGNVQLDCVINLHQWIRVTDGAPIMGGDERNTFGSDLDALDFAQFVLGFLSGNSVDGESSLDIIDQSEELSGLVDGDDIHESGWVVGVSADFAVNFDQPLHDNFGHFRVVQGILESVTKENHHGQGFPQFVWTSAWSGSENSTQFVQHP